MRCREWCEKIAGVPSCLSTDEGVKPHENSTTPNAKVRRMVDMQHLGNIIADGWLWSEWETDTQGNAAPGVNPTSRTPSGPQWLYGV